MLLSLHHVRKAFGDHVVLRDISLTVEPGVSLALIGPNGAGKTTLLKVLSGLTTPDLGEVTWGQGFDHHALGLVTHQPCIYSELSARENLLYFGRLYHVEHPRQRVAELLAELGLEGAADRPAGSFSRGMQQRLAIARALLAKPRLLLLDEPFSGLDYSGTQMLCRQLHRLQEAGLTLVLSTHLLHLADDLTRQALFLRQGELHPAGDGGSLTDQYRAIFEVEA